jgi:hypothetical protein
MPTEKILPVNFRLLGRFGIGEQSNGLYFDGERVHTDSVVSLTKKQQKFAIVVSIATIVAALSSLSYSVVYVIDTLLRTKPPAQVEISTPKQLPFPVILPEVSPKEVAPAPPPPPQAAPAQEPAPAPTSPPVQRQPTPDAPLLKQDQH